ncbi:MAG: hypothetical protein V4726_01350 [Verrucomicrobiota bacterium]
MKFLPWQWLPLSLVSFGAGLGGVVVLWPGHETPVPPPGRGLTSEAASVPSPPELEKPGPSATETLRAVEPGEIPDGALRLAGLDAAPMLKEVLSSSGLERTIRMNLFLRGLTKPADWRKTPPPMWRVSITPTLPPPPATGPPPFLPVLSVKAPSKR